MLLCAGQITRKHNNRVQMVSSAQPILQVQNLEASYLTDRGVIKAVRNVSLTIDPAETLGIVGESGCGKSTLAFSIMGYLGVNGRITGGQLLFRGEDLLRKSRRELRRVRGANIAMVYQDPQSALNPSIRVGEQIAEALRAIERLSRRAAEARTLELLEAVHMPDQKGVAQAYPHQLSGGMQQRVVIALALSCNPDVLIMDEPTTGLDVTTEARILDLVNELKAQYDCSILYITHNLGVIARVCDRVAVMYAGEIVEINTARGIFESPGHPYTLDLLNCIPRLGSRYEMQRLRPIRGRAPRSGELLPGCTYEPRCLLAHRKCARGHPPLAPVGLGHQLACFFSDEVVSRESPHDAELVPEEEQFGKSGETLLATRDLRMTYDERHRRFFLFGPLVGRQVRAINGVTTEVAGKETLGLVGESGCGKTTLARCIVGLQEPSGGEVHFKGTKMAKTASKRSASTRRGLQIVFQNPDLSLNHRHVVGQIIGRPLRLFHIARGKELRQRLLELLEMVKLDATYLDRYPAELSGGEKQRVAIARAFAGDPNIVVCDEAVSSLDVSVQASILNLLVRLQRENGTSYFFISHDLGVVRYVADRIAVMYLGQFAEVGTVEQVFMPPCHPYTEALLSAIPVPDPRSRQEGIRLEGPVPSVVQAIAGCPFHTRCPRIYGEVCRVTEPPWQHAGGGHVIRCHIPLEELTRFGTLGKRLAGPGVGDTLHADEGV